MLDFLKLKQKFEDLIRAGEIAAVQNELEKINVNDIDREWVATFADIARRVRSENWGLRLLRPLVRSEVPVRPAVNENELCAYAGLLIKAGALAEAKDILTPIDPQKVSNVYTFLSQVYILQWDYAKASEFLKEGLWQKDLTAYQRCISQVNLVSAFIFLQKYKLARTLISEVLKNSFENKWDLLYGNALELSAQLAVIQGQWVDAKNFLSEAQKRSGQHSHYSIFIDKWSTLNDLLQSHPGSQQSDQILKKIDQIRQKASSLNSWETMRDLDYHVGVHLKHQNLLLNVYFGTPHASFKKRIEQLFKKHHWKIPNEYFRKLSEAPTTRVLDLITGVEIGVPLLEPLKAGQMLHRLLNILALDFYKPMGLGELFSNLFPGEYFNPDTSGDRVTQAVKLLRKWFQVNEIPVDVHVENNRFGLKATGPYAFKISKKVLDPMDLHDVGFDLQISQLKTKWPYQSFSAAKAAAQLQVSATTMRSILHEALNKKLLFVSGTGRATLYRFKK